MFGTFSVYMLWHLYVWKSHFMLVRDIGEPTPGTHGHLGHVIWPRESEDMTILKQGYHCNSFATIDMDSRISVK
jgi:hypothetical protein